MHSYWGKCLIIDLTAQKSEVRELPQSLLRNYLGGVGLGTRLLLEWAKPGTDALSPDNPLIFASSGLAGTMAPASGNHAVVTKSPLSGFVSDSVSSGHWSLSLKRAGYDAVVITGAASSPVYVFVDNEIVHFHKADHLIGQGSFQTAEAIRRHTGDDRVQVASIGPGGENMVRYACINNSYCRATRGGAGAVMGSKRLKAIAIRGTRAVSAYDLRGVERASIDLYARAQAETASGHKNPRTPDNLLTINRLDTLPTRNFQQSSFEQANITEEYLAANHLVKVIACPTCPIACEHLYRVVDGGPEVALDYESLAALGPLCGIDSVPAMLKAVELCQFYGMDTVSTGSSIAWAMESFEKGLLTKEDTQGINLSFGNPEALVAIVESIGKRNGIGDLLAEGTKRASAKLGRGSERWAMHSKGLELAGYDPRTMKSQALRFAVGLEIRSNDCFHCGDEDRHSASSISLSNQEGEDTAAVSNSLMICGLIHSCFSDFLSEAAHLYTLATGIHISPAELKQAGERINNLKKTLNIREGWRRSDDWLPPRLFKDPIPSGKAKGAVLSDKDLQAMIDGYYQSRGWTIEGLIPTGKLKALGMDDILEMAKGSWHGASLHTV